MYILIHEKLTSVCTWCKSMLHHSLFLFHSLRFSIHFYFHIQTYARWRSKSYAKNANEHECSMFAYVNFALFLQLLRLDCECRWFLLYIRLFCWFSFPQGENVLVLQFYFSHLRKHRIWKINKLWNEKYLKWWKVSFNIHNAFSPFSFLLYIDNNIVDFERVSRRVAWWHINAFASWNSSIAHIWSSIAGK